MPISAGRWRSASPGRIVAGADLFTRSVDATASPTTAASERRPPPPGGRSRRGRRTRRSRSSPMPHFVAHRVAPDVGSRRRIQYARGGSKSHGRPPRGGPPASARPLGTHVSSTSRSIGLCRARPTRAARPVRARQCSTWYLPLSDLEPPLRAADESRRPARRLAPSFVESDLLAMNPDLAADRGSTCGNGACDDSARRQAYISRSRRAHGPARSRSPPFSWRIRTQRLIAVRGGALSRGRRRGKPRAPPWASATRVPAR